MTPSDLAIVAGKALDEYASELFASVAPLTGSRAMAVSALRDLAVACDGQPDGSLPDYPRWRGVGHRIDFAALAYVLVCNREVFSSHVQWLADDVRRWGREWAALDDGGVAA